MEFQINDILDNEDGTFTLRVDMDNEAMIVFAKVGLLKTLIDEANRVTEAHDNAYSEDQSDNSIAD